MAGLGPPEPDLHPVPQPVRPSGTVERTELENAAIGAVAATVHPFTGVSPLLGGGSRGACEDLRSVVRGPPPSPVASRSSRHASCPSRTGALPAVARSAEGSRGRGTRRRPVGRVPAAVCPDGRIERGRRLRRHGSPLERGVDAPWTGSATGPASGHPGGRVWRPRRRSRSGWDPPPVAPATSSRHVAGTPRGIERPRPPSRVRRVAVSTTPRLEFVAGPGTSSGGPPEPLRAGRGTRRPRERETRTTPDGLPSEEPGSGPS